MVEIGIIESKILDLLMQCNNSGVTRGFICFHTKLARTTVYDNLRKLARKGAVKKYSKNVNGTRGRPHVFWRLKG